MRNYIRSGDFMDCFITMFAKLYALSLAIYGRLATWKQPRSEPMLPLGFGYTVDSDDK